MIRIDSVLTLAKSITAKTTKDGSGMPVTIAQVKFADMLVDRDALDELLGVPLGWCRTCLYDEQGAPLRRFGLQVFGRTLRVSGTVTGTKPGETLSLLQADLDDTELRCVPLGALMNGVLTWAARGDEVEDVSELLGRLCSARWEITDGEPGDMFRPTSIAGAKATEITQQVLDGLKRGGTQ
jgi:hypothetical protein